MSIHDEQKPVNTSGAHRIWAALRILQVRLRFIALMVLVGIIAGNWEDLMNHYDRWRRPAAVIAGEQVQEIEYYYAMHPNVIRVEPGQCPICGMAPGEACQNCSGASNCRRGYWHRCI